MSQAVQDYSSYVVQGRPLYLISLEHGIIYLGAGFGCMQNARIMGSRRQPQDSKEKFMGPGEYKSVGFLVIHLLQGDMHGALISGDSRMSDSTNVKHLLRNPEGNWQTWSERRILCPTSDKVIGIGPLKSKGVYTVILCVLDVDHWVTGYKVYSACLWDHFDPIYCMTFPRET